MIVTKKARKQGANKAWSMITFVIAPFAPESMLCDHEIHVKHDQEIKCPALNEACIGKRTFRLDATLHDKVEGSDTGSRDAAAHQEEANCPH